MCIWMWVSHIVLKTIFLPQTTYFQFLGSFLVRLLSLEVHPISYYQSFSLYFCDRTDCPSKQKEDQRVYLLYIWHHFCLLLVFKVTSGGGYIFLIDFIYFSILLSSNLQVIYISIHCRMLFITYKCLQENNFSYHLHSKLYYA